MRSPGYFVRRPISKNSSASRRGFQKKLGAVIDNPIPRRLAGVGVARGSGVMPARSSLPLCRRERRRRSRLQGSRPRARRGFARLSGRLRVGLPCFTSVAVTQIPGSAVRGADTYVRQRPRAGVTIAQRFCCGAPGAIPPPCKGRLLP